MSYNAHSEIAFNRLNVFQFDVVYNKYLIITLYRNKNYIFENNLSNILYETTVVNYSVSFYDRVQLYF